MLEPYLIGPPHTHISVIYIANAMYTLLKSFDAQCTPVESHSVAHQWT